MQWRSGSRVGDGSVRTVSHGEKAKPRSKRGSAVDNLSRTQRIPNALLYPGTSLAVEHHLDMVGAQCPMALCVSSPLGNHLTSTPLKILIPSVVRPPIAKKSPGAALINWAVTVLLSTLRLA